MIPTRKQIIKALLDEDSLKSTLILRPLSASQKWGNGSSLCKCPLCGYETEVTNVHRNCPETPAIERIVLPKYCFEHETRHFIEENGKKIWTQHKSVIMYVVEDSQLQESPVEYKLKEET